MEFLSSIRSCLSEELASTDGSKAAKPPLPLLGAAKLSASVLWQGSPAPPAPEVLLRLKDRILCPYHRTLEQIVKPGICAVLGGPLAGHFKVAEVREFQPPEGKIGQKHVGAGGMLEPVVSSHDPPAPLLGV